MSTPEPPKEEKKFDHFGNHVEKEMERRKSIGPQVLLLAGGAGGLWLWIRRNAKRHL